MYRDITIILYTGLLDTITSTADSKDCPGVCVHTLATLICYEVLEDVACPSPSMRCCIESPPGNASTTTATPTTQATTVATPSPTPKPMTKPQVTSTSFKNMFRLSKNSQW